MAKAPCKGCTFRQIGCYSRCEKYMKFQAENEAEKLARNIQAAVNDYFAEKHYVRKRKYHEHHQKLKSGGGSVYK